MATMPKKQKGVGGAYSKVRPPRKKATLKKGKLPPSEKSQHSLKVDGEKKGRRTASEKYQYPPKRRRKSGNLPHRPPRSEREEKVERPNYGGAISSEELRDESPARKTSGAKPIKRRYGA